MRRTLNPEPREKIKYRKTIIRSTAIYSTPEDLQKVIDMGMEGGIRETMDKLEEYLAVMK